MDADLLHSAIVRLLKKTEIEQKQVLRSFVKMPIQSRLKVMEISKDIFYPLKEKNKDIPLSALSYVSLIAAIEKYKATTNNIDKNILDLRLKSFGKYPKKDKLIDKWALIKELKTVKKLSWREISKYLKKYHKLDVAHSTIYDLWKKFEKIDGE